MMVLRKFLVTPEKLLQLGVALEIQSKLKPFPEITISSRIEKDPPHYVFERVRLIIANEEVTAFNFDRISVEGSHIVSSSFSSERHASYDFIGSQRRNALLIFQYRKTDEEWSPEILFCLPISTLIDEEKNS